MIALLQKVGISILLALFMIYSSSISVVWMLYFYEKHDVILYYCPHDAQNGGDGTSYIHRLLDSTMQSHARTIISPADNLPQILEISTLVFTAKVSVLIFREVTPSPQLGFTTELLRPPTT
ncbi:MAG: hypothetical protein IPM69_15185 [Ignavibacteria bacterium]|nr:hypothetical protein [Ignavibacteria bacterium]